MSFLLPDEFNILMDCLDIGESPYLPGFYSRAVPLDDMKRLADAGVRTVLQLVPNAETKRGLYDWRLIDETIGRARMAGMKTLLMGPNTVPLWCPDSWYVWAADNTVMRDHDRRNIIQTWGCLSPWSADAQHYLRKYAERFTQRYNCSDVLCLSSYSQEGESVLPPATACLYDPAARESYRLYAGDRRAIPDATTALTQQWMFESCLRVILGLQAIYAKHPSHTVSMQLHPCYLAPQWCGSAVYDLASYLRAVKEVIHPETFLWFLFAWYSREGRAVDGKFIFERHWPLAARLKEELHLDVITGSEWPEGLALNTQRSIDDGFRALLTAPLHPYLHRDKIEPEVFEWFAQSKAVHDQRVLEVMNA